MLWLFRFVFKVHANKAEADDNNVKAKEAIDAKADETD